MLAKSLFEPSSSLESVLIAVSVMLKRWESLTPPGRDANPSQFSSQHTMVIIYCPRKDRKIIQIWRERMSNIYWNISRAGERTRGLEASLQKQVTFEIGCFTFKKLGKKSSKPTVAENSVCENYSLLLKYTFIATFWLTNHLNHGVDKTIMKETATWMKPAR